jgi:TrmH family RNA methyltransferase
LLRSRGDAAGFGLPREKGPAPGGRREARSPGGHAGGEPSAAPADVHDLARRLHARPVRRLRRVPHLRRVTKRIAARDNALYKTLARLASSSRARREQGAALLDGPHLVSAYAASGAIAETLVASESAYARPEIRALLDGTPARSRVLLTDRLFDSLAQVASPTGILAVVRTPGPAGEPAALETCLMLESLQDPGNLGSMLRTAVAAGIRQVFLGPGCVFAWAPKVLRAGQGAHFGLSIHERVALAPLAARFQGTVVATDPHAHASLFDLDLTGPVAWVFGGEGAGVSPGLAARATVRARIPMPGPAESLNVAAAAAVCLFEQVRQRARGEGRSPRRRDPEPAKEP